MSTFVGTTPTGSVNGVNMVFTLGTFLPTTLEVYVNGVLQNPGVDYTLSTATTTGVGTATISFAGTSIPQSGDILNSWIFNQ